MELPFVESLYSSLLLLDDTLKSEPVDSELVASTYLFPFLACLDEDAFMGVIVPGSTLSLVRKQRKENKNLKLKFSVHVLLRVRVGSTGRINWVRLI